MNVSRVWPEAEDSIGRPICGLTACESCGRKVFCGMQIEARKVADSYDSAYGPPLLYMPPHRCMDCPAAKAEGLRHVARVAKVHLRGKLR
jgi:hypothetical protein